MLKILVPHSGNRWHQLCSQTILGFDRRRWVAPRNRKWCQWLWFRPQDGRVLDQSNELQCSDTELWYQWGAEMIMLSDSTNFSWPITGAETELAFIPFQVMGPDEYHARIDNNLYTNIVAQKSVYLTNFSSCAANCEDVPQEWLEMSAGRDWKGITVLLIYLKICNLIKSILESFYYWTTLNFILVGLRS